MRCQSKVNCSSQVCWRQVNLQGLWLQKEKKMTNSTDVSDVKMTRFGNRVDLFRERHGRVKDEAKIASRGTDWDDIIAER